MQWPITSIKLGLASSWVMILLIGGCQPVPVVEPEPHKPVSVSPTIEQETTTPLTPVTPGIPVETPTPPVSTPITTPPKTDVPSSEPANVEEGIHIVQPGGETLYSIALRYGQQLEDVAAWNHLTPPYYLTEGQRLVVSPPTIDESFIPEPVQPTPPISVDNDYYVVLPGDELEDIAKHYHVSVDELAAWNGLQPPYDLDPAQELRVRSPDDDMDNMFPVPSPNPIWNSETFDNNGTFDDNGEDYDDENADYHIVGPGDTLSNIGKRYGISIEELMKWNHLYSQNLKVGQELRVAPLRPEPAPIPIINNGSHSVDSRPSYHVVKLGETLDSIAKKYGVSRYELAKWNKIGSPYTVFPGLKLTLVPSP